MKVREDELNKKRKASGKVHIRVKRMSFVSAHMYVQAQSFHVLIKEPIRISV